ncbi:MAG: winged helix-turn-helix domain-containing protein [Bryobacteraceae bacterium]
MSFAAGKLVSVARKVRFGAFEVDLQNRELRKLGLRLKLQHKPFQILEILIHAQGQLVRRTDLAKQLWPDLHVSFDRSLNTAVNSLRQVLGDSSQNPRYIETRSGLGYRFIAPVEEVAAPAPDSASPPVSNAEAHRDYLQGRYFLNKLSDEDLHKSVAYFEAALKQNPGYAPAHAGMADAYIMFALLNLMPPGEAYARIERAARSAVEAVPDLCEAHATLATVKRIFERDWAGAEGEHARALELNPRSEIAHQQYGTFLAAAGRAEEAREAFRRARELDPLSLTIHAEAAWSLYVARDFAASAEQCWQALVMEPKFAAAQHILGLAYEQMGMIEEAVVELENARTCAGDRPCVVAALAHVHARAGMAAEADELLKRLRETALRRYVSPYWYGLAHAGLEDREGAFGWLEKARQERDVWLTWLKVDPRFQPLQSDARFGALLRDCGL